MRRQEYLVIDNVITNLKKGVVMLKAEKPLINIEKILVECLITLQGVRVPGTTRENKVFVSRKVRTLLHKLEKSAKSKSPSEHLMEK